MGQMRAPPRNGKDPLGNGAAVLGARETAAAKPVPEKAVKGLGGLFQTFQDLDGHLQAGSGCHFS